MAHLILSHGIVAKPEELGFLPDRNHTACKICGTIFQSWFDQLPLDEVDDETIMAGLIQRMDWSKRHARTHSQHVHDTLRKSGRFATPEATVKLAAYGISPISDMVFSDESAQAALEAPRCPLDDVETTKDPRKGVSVAIR